MRAVALRFEIHIPDSQSLKDKRAVIRPLVEGLRRLVSASVAEVDHHDAWQRASIGVALVAADAGRLEALITRVRRYVDDQLELDVVEVAVHHMEEAP
jgi:uncharacterized protein YlxP (DUF503 family)